MELPWYSCRQSAPSLSRSFWAADSTYLMNGLVVFSVGIPCAVSGIVGNLLGSHFALKNGAKFIRPMMLVVLVLLLGKLVSDAVL